MISQEEMKMNVKEISQLIKTLDTSGELLKELDSLSKDLGSIAGMASSLKDDKNIPQALRLKMMYIAEYANSLIDLSTSTSEADIKNLPPIEEPTTEDLKMDAYINGLSDDQKFEYLASKN